MLAIYFKTRGFKVLFAFRESMEAQRWSHSNDGHRCFLA